VKILSASGLLSQCIKTLHSELKLYLLWQRFPRIFYLTGVTALTSFDSWLGFFKPIKKAGGDMKHLWGLFERTILAVISFLMLGGTGYGAEMKIHPRLFHGGSCWDGVVDGERDRRV
jgi:hypothetical protein